jgi:hypothetical protein
MNYAGGDAIRWPWPVDIPTSECCNYFVAEIWHWLDPRIRNLEQEAYRGDRQRV